MNQLFKKLTETNGISGHENQVYEVMAKAIKPYVDKIEKDRLGSLVAIKKGSSASPKIMIAGHLDEVGFMVSRIDENGFIYFQPVGGWWSQVLLSQRVTITNSKGQEFIGIIGSKPPHILPLEERNKVVKIDQMYIDLGVDSIAEVQKKGIKIGDMITPYFEFNRLLNPKYMVAKAWDNRIGIAIVIELMKKLKKIKHPNTIYGVGSVQEEVGLRGARTCANKIKPDLGIAVDVGIGGGTPGVSMNEADAKLGKGPMIVVYDSALITHKGFKDLIINLCEKKQIPYQLEAKLGGGTDAGAISLSHDGTPAVSISMPSRYIHSHASIIHEDDFNNLVKLLVELVKIMDQKTYKKLI